jgi:hypothetical protein
LDRGLPHYAGVSNGGGGGDDQSSIGSDSSSGEALDLLTHDSLSGEDILLTTDDETGFQNRASRRKLRKERRQEQMSQMEKKATNIKPLRNKSHDSDFHHPDFHRTSSSLSLTTEQPEHGGTSKLSLYGCNIFSFGGFICVVFYFWLLAYTTYGLFWILFCFLLFQVRK